MRSKPFSLGDGLPGDCFSDSCRRCPRPPTRSVQSGVAALSRTPIPQTTLANRHFVLRRAACPEMLDGGASLPCDRVRAAGPQPMPDVTEGKLPSRLVHSPRSSTLSEMDSTQLHSV